MATVFDLLGHLWKTLDAQGVYVIDSFPVAVCDNIRIRRAKLYRTVAMNWIMRIIGVSLSL